MTWLILRDPVAWKIRRYGSNMLRTVHDRRHTAYIMWFASLTNKVMSFWNNYKNEFHNKGPNDVP